MRLIVDSGSTKSDWVLIDENQNQLNFSTIGFNPYFHDAQFIARHIKLNEELYAQRENIEVLNYYGAGCSSKDLNVIVYNALRRIFVFAEITVDHDLTACAYSTYEGEPSISCILGTGSNSCFFDGDKVFEEVPALAYILGDEGSGSYYGKKILSEFLYKRMPKHIYDDFKNTFNLSKTEILENVYMKPHANVYIASFMKFISNHRDDTYFKDMIFEGMKHFMSIHVCCYKNFKDVKTHFIGSIGHYFREELTAAAEVLGVNVGSVVKKPINGLVHYHLNYHSRKIGA